MAKKITIDIEVNGKMQKATVSTKKLKDAIDGVDDANKRTGKSTGQLDRNLKGTAQATSNTTKEFAKMSQGMGGLVAVYAQIAAASFAVSAAFLFLKDSMDTRNLMEGQKAFGAVTGVAYQTLTKDIREATDGMLSFRDAAQAAAIGTAAGLSRGQLEQLGSAAKNVSFALGRDLTDSFNRLVRGVTKAEPELLDELGIILRLDPALKAYSVAIGKNVKDLNQFEKSQAIANEVLTQAEQKFGAIAKIMDPNSAALAQFQQSFTDLMNSFKEGLANSLIPVFNFLKDNTASLIGALGLIALPIARQILPNFEAMGKAANKAYAKASKAAEAAKADAATFAATSKLAAGSESDRAKIVSSSADRGKGLGIQMKGQLKHDGMLSKRQLGIYRKMLNTKERMRKRFTAQERIEFRAFMAEQEALHATSEGKKVSATQQAEMAKRTLYAQTVAAYKAGQAMMVAATEKAAKGMNRVMKFAGIVGLGLLLFDMGKMFKDMLFPMSEAEKKAEKLKEELQSAVETQQTLNDELGRMIQVRFDRDIGLGLAERITQEQQALQSVDVNKTFIDYETLGKGNKVLAEGLADTFDNLAKITGNQGFGKAAIVFREQGDVSQKAKEALLEYTNQAIQAGIAVARLAELQKATNAAFQQAAPSGLKFAGVATAVKSELEGLKKILEKSKGDLKDLETTLATTAVDIDPKVQEKFDNYTDRLEAYPKLLESQGRELTFDEKGFLTDISRSRGEGVSKINTMKKSYNDLLIQQRALGEDISLTTAEQEALNTQIKEAGAFIGKNTNRFTRLLQVYKDIQAVQTKGVKLQKQSATQDIKLEKLRSNSAFTAFEKDKEKLNIEQRKREIVVGNANLQLDIAKLGAQALDKDYEKLKAAEKEGTLTNEAEKAALAAIELAMEQVTLAETKRDIGADLLAIEKELLNIKEQEKVLDLISLEMELRKGKLLLGATSVQKRRIDREAQETGLILKRAELMLKFEEEMIKARKENNQVAIAGLLLQLDLIAQQEAALLRNKDTMTAVADAMNEAFQTGIQSGLESLITGDEKSFTTAALKIGEAVARAGVKKLTERITEDLFTSEEEKPENKIKLAMMQAAEYHAQAIRAAIEGKPAPGAPTGTGSEPAGLPSQPRKYGKEVAKEWGAFTDSVSDIFATGTGASFIDRIGMAFGQGGALLQTAFGGLFSGLSSMLSGLFSGGSSGRGIFSMFLSAALGAFAPGSGTTTPKAPAGPTYRTLPTPQNPGPTVIKARYGAMPKYAQGGIARGSQAGYPAMLHGTEAVIPMPNKKSIPVDLQGAGQNNNVVVNVSVDSSGQGKTDTQADGTDSKKLGTLIASAVQKELHNQKRSGGILNPMGAS